MRYDKHMKKHRLLSLILAFLFLPPWCVPSAARAEEADLLCLQPPLIASDGYFTCSDGAAQADYYALHPQEDPTLPIAGEEDQNIPSEGDFRPPVLLGTPDYSYVHVLLSTSGSSISVTLNGCYSLRSETGATCALPSYGSVYTFSASGGTVYVYYGGLLLASGATLSLFEHTPFSDTGGNYFSLYNSAYGTRSYRGGLSVYAENGALRCVNRVYMEDYLCGVVGNEIGDFSPSEALKAQAVAARSYAVKNISASARYDLKDTSASQVYKGICGDQANSAAAVQATAKQVLVKNGSLVLGLYSSSNGGEKDTSRNRWGGNAAWSGEAVAVDTPDLIYSRNYALQKNSNSYYEEAVFPINGTKTADTTALITHSLLPLLVSSGYCSSSATAANVTLAGLSMTYTPAAKTDAVSYLSYLNITYTGSVNGRAFSCTDSIYYTKFYVANGWGLFSNGSLNQYWIATDGSNYILRHARRGHGIGLSQIGARQWALSGASCSSILQFYYDGASTAVSPYIGDKALTLRGMTLPQGDVYIDIVISIQDVLLLCRYLAGNTSLNATQLSNADVNADGSATLSDAVLICRYLAGLM